MKPSSLPTGVYLQMGHLFDMPVKILLDSYKIIILDAGLRVPFFQAKKWICQGVGHRTKETWEGAMV